MLRLTIRIINLIYFEILFLIFEDHSNLTD